MTSHERFTKVFNHEAPDRIPIIDNPWRGTIARWRREGMGEADFTDYFGLDKTAGIWADNSPRFESRTVEETEEYRVYTTSWGATLKSWKREDSTPEFMDFTITDPDAWRAAKARMAPTRDRVDWDALAKDYPRWRKEGRWINASFWFGFDVTHSWVVGTERVLMALIEDPEWITDMWNTELDVHLALFEMVWDAGYTFDCIHWCDDLGYKHNQFMSVKMYRDLLKPVHQRAAEWAHQRGVKVEMHSCGDVTPLVPEFIDFGVDALNPLEVKAGMDPVALKDQYGDRLVFHGGINAVKWTDIEAIEEEMRRVVPKMKVGGGYIFSSDHSVPNAVSLQNFRHIVELAKELGRST